MYPFMYLREEGYIRKEDRDISMRGERCIRKRIFFFLKNNKKF